MCAAVGMQHQIDFHFAPHGLREAETHCFGYGMHADDEVEFPIPQPALPLIRLNAALVLAERPEYQQRPVCLLNVTVVTMTSQVLAMVCMQPGKKSCGSMQVIVTTRTATQISIQRHFGTAAVRMGSRGHRKCRQVAAILRTRP